MGHLVVVTGAKGGGCRKEIRAVFSLPDQRFRLVKEGKSVFPVGMPANRDDMGIVAEGLDAGDEGRGLEDFSCSGMSVLTVFEMDLGPTAFDNPE